MLRCVFAGFGGQGVLFIGKVLAQAGMMAGKQVTWIPSYGPEMRGGTANCSVIISDKKIGSPTVGRPDLAVVMNEASYKKFLPVVRPGGTLYFNSTLIQVTEGRADIRIVSIPANEIAHELGGDSVANIVMLGALQALTPSVADEVLMQTLSELAGKKSELVALNQRAIAAGRTYALGRAEKKS